MATPVPISYENEIEVLTEHEVHQDRKNLRQTEEEHSCSSVKSAIPDQNIASQPLTGGTSVVKTYTKHPHYLPLALFVCLVNLPFGIVALVFSLRSRNFSIKGDFIRCQTSAQISMWVSFVGIACSVVTCVFITVYFLVMEPNIIRSLEELNT